MRRPSRSRRLRLHRRELRRRGMVTRLRVPTTRMGRLTILIRTLTTIHITAITDIRTIGGRASVSTSAPVFTATTMAITTAAITVAATTVAATTVAATTVAGIT